MPSNQKFILALTLLCASATVQAGPIYQFNSASNPSGSSAAGDVKNVSTSYNASTEVFSWSYDITSGQGNDAFWLVVSTGPNPKDLVPANSLGIIFGDFSSSSKPGGASTTSTLTAYSYNGLNNNTSYTPSNPVPTKLDQWNNEITVTPNLPVGGAPGTQTVSFSIDVSDVNDAFNTDWSGIQFGNEIGIWFHPSSGSSISYNLNGDITNYGFDHQSWYDTAHKTTTEIPEPAGIALLAAGLLGLGISRRQIKFL